MVRLGNTTLEVTGTNPTDAENRYAFFQKGGHRQTRHQVRALPNQRRGPPAEGRRADRWLAKRRSTTPGWLPALLRWGSISQRPGIFRHPHLVIPLGVLELEAF